MKYRQGGLPSLPIKKRERRPFRQEYRRSLNTTIKEAILSIAPVKASGKPKMLIRYKPTKREGRYIQYRLRLSGETFASIARKLNLHKSTPDRIIYGQRRSARIEAEIARILGKADWNEVVLEARSEVQKKPVKVILEEMRRAREERRENQRAALGAAIGGREIEVVDQRRRA